MFSMISYVLFDLLTSLAGEEVWGGGALPPIAIRGGAAL